MKTLSTILHATDFSELAAHAFQAAYALARAHGAKLYVLYVKQPQETMQGEFGLMPPEPEETDDEIAVKLGELIPSDAPISIEPLLAHGVAVQAIVQVAKDKQCDLIVLGSHGRKGLARLFYGNVADSVTRSAPCPVLALRSASTEA